MKIIFYQAECGDTARIEYTGTDNKIHNIFIDSGYERTFRKILAVEIKKIADTSTKIDCWVISHIHDDHIGGALAFIKAVRSGRLPDNIDRWLYNPPRGYVVDSGNASDKISTAKSIAQGDALAEYLLSKGMSAVEDTHAASKPLELYGMKLTFLSPDQATLSALRKKYPAGTSNAFEREEGFLISGAKTAARNDYHIKLSDFELSNKQEDNSIENGSSISILSELNQKKILWLSDAHPSVIIKSLNDLGYSENNRLHCDWVKVAHHGSSANNLSQLYDIIQCNNYLVSVNGVNKYQLPSKECLARIIRSQSRTNKTCHIYFTYDNPTLRSIFSVDSPDLFKYFNFEVHYLSSPASVFEC